MLITRLLAYISHVFPRRVLWSLFFWKRSISRLLHNSPQSTTIVLETCKCHFHVLFSTVICCPKHKLHRNARDTLSSVSKENEVLFSSITHLRCSSCETSIFSKNFLSLLMILFVFPFSLFFTSFNICVTFLETSAEISDVWSWD